MIKENKGVFSGIIPIEAIISAIGSIIIYAFFLWINIGIIVY